MSFLHRRTDPTSPSGNSGNPSRHSYRFGLVVTVVAVIISVILIPVAIASLVSALQHPVGGSGYDLVRPITARGEWTKLNIAAVSINEAEQTATFRVSGFHNCSSGCNEVERVQFFSIHSNPSGALGPPPSTSIDLPPDSSEVNQSITLPVSGNLSDYPFDHYSLVLGVSLSQVNKSGSIEAVHVGLAHQSLTYSFDDDVPRVSLSSPKTLNPGSYNSANIIYDSVTSFDFFRPTYLRILAVLLTSLIVLAAGYGILCRPFTQIISTVGASILGVWGVRSLLVGYYPPDSTGVDLVLEGAILLLLFAIAVRALWYMWPLAFPHRAQSSENEATRSNN